ncbi:MAG TPA: hypothetical protein VGK73_31605 [Polyangiaceae bacterium]
MTSPKTKPVVTMADREAAWKAMNAGLLPVDAALRGFVERWFAGDVELTGASAKTLDDIALGFATARTEAHAAGYAECQRDAGAFVRASGDDVGARDIEAGEHVGAAKEVE